MSRDTDLATALRNAAERARGLAALTGHPADICGFMGGGDVDIEWLAARLDAAGIPHARIWPYSLTLDPLCPESLAWCANVLGPEDAPC